MRRSILILALCGVLGSAIWAWQRTRAPIGPADVLLISIDTLRADHLGAYGREAARTPFLDRVASEGTLYERAYSAVPITLPSHATMLSGLVPPNHGARDNGGYRVGDDVEMLAERLRARGYATGAFIAGEPLLRGSGLAQGFERYDDDLAHKELSTKQSATRPERYAEEVLALARAWLSNQSPDRPVFAFIHLYDPHEPYEKALPGSSTPSYDGEIAYVDRELERFFGTLERDPRWKEATLIVTSDHGEGLGEHGEATHCIFVYDSTLHVPLIVRGPTFPSGKRVVERVGLVDVAPTVIELAGLAPSHVSDGRSLASSWAHTELPPRQLYFESLFGELRFGWAPLRGLRKDALKYIDAPRAELYDTDQDPGERENAIDAHGADASAFAANLREAGTGEHSTRAIDRATVAELAKLGYVSAPPVEKDGEKDGEKPDPKDRVGVYDRFQEAHRLFLEGKLKESLAAMESLEHDLADSPYFQLDRGNFAAAAQNWTLARDCYERCLALNPGERDARLNLGTTYLSLSEPEKALASFQRVLEHWPDDPDALVYLGLVKFRYLNDRRGAIPHWRQFLEVAPKDPRAPEIRRGLAQLETQ